MNSRLLLAQLTYEEGNRLKPYVDTRGNVTIGRGHNLTADGISEAVSLQIFDEDVTLAMTRLATIWPEWSTMDEVRQRVFVDLAFNMGMELATFRDLLAAAKAGHWDAAADALQASNWYGEVGRRGPILVSMLRSGVDPAWLTIS